MSSDPPDPGYGNAMEVAAWQAGWRARADSAVPSSHAGTNEPEDEAINRATDNAWLRFCLENCRLLAARHRKEEWAQNILRFCAEAKVTGSPLRAPAVPSSPLPQCTYLVDTEAKRHGMHPAYRSLQNVMKYGGESTFEQVFTAQQMLAFATDQPKAEGESILREALARLPDEQIAERYRAKWNIHTERNEMTMFGYYLEGWRDCEEAARSALAGIPLNASGDESGALRLIP